MGNQLIKTELLSIPDALNPLSKPPEVRISFYFNTDHDNHHIQFKNNISRRKLVGLLHDLIELIKNGGNNG